VDWNSVNLTYTRDADGNIDTATITGQFKDIGENDVHQLGVVWGDGNKGDGIHNAIVIQGRDFSLTRRFPPEFGNSVRRLFPIKLGVRDDDLGVDSGHLDATTYWSFDAMPTMVDTRDLTPRTVQPFNSPSHAGSIWKGYGEAKINAVPADSNFISGDARAASVLAYPGILADPNFADTLFRASSLITFSIACDRATGDITTQVTGGGGGKSVVLSPNGNFIGWDPTADEVQRNGPLAGSTSVQFSMTPSPGRKSIDVNLEAHFGFSTNLTIVNENGPQIEGPGGRIVAKQGTTSNYPSGLEDYARKTGAYVCKERVSLIKTDLED
jgi:hypothetical protein